MRFGPAPLNECEGAILAHSLRLPGLVIKKGVTLTKSDLTAAAAHDIKELTVAMLEPDEINEDEAARQIASALGLNGIDVAEAGTGRVNFHAAANGVFCVSSELVDQINSIDPGITFATLAPYEPVLTGRMIATIKIIPYGISNKTIGMVKKIASKSEAMSVEAYSSKRIGVISTILPGLKDKTIAKTLDVLERRLKPSGSRIVAHSMAAHEATAIQGEISKLKNSCDLIIVFGASAISDISDVIPAGLKLAGGEVLRLGMPVDPGNLLMLGQLGSIPVLGAPGCARSPAENGFDFVLNRLLADIEVTSMDIAGMGVGGLLMEIGSRPQPRQSSPDDPIHIAGIVLAGGQSRRMGAINKLTETVKGKPMVCHAIDASIQAGLEELIVVTGHESAAVRDAIGERQVQFVQNDEFAEGLSTSLKAGIGALDASVTHALVLLGDMPKISSDDIKRFIEAASTAENPKIIVATHLGKRGNPVLWPKAHFEALMAISGDTGARHIIGENSDDVILLELGETASLDLDTPEALSDYRNRS